MLRLLNESEFDTYIDFAYELALDLTRSGYPTYCDGIKTREDFIAAVRKTFIRPDKKALLFLQDGQVEGLIAFDCLEEEHYLHPYIFNIRRDTGTALAEFVDYCRERWPGFDLDLGFPAENTQALSWLEGAGIPCIERSWNYVYFLDRYTPLPEDPFVRRITAENFEEFTSIHKQIESDMYWTCERVRNTPDDWAIFVTGEGDTAGEVLLTNWEGAHQEIFALEFSDEYAFRGLLTAALNHLKSRGTKYLTFFVDDGSAEGKILTDLGFQLAGGYVAHRLKL